MSAPLEGVTVVLRTYVLGRPSMIFSKHAAVTTTAAATEAVMATAPKSINDLEQREQHLDFEILFVARTFFVYSLFPSRTKQICDVDASLS